MAAVVTAALALTAALAHPAHITVSGQDPRAGQVVRLTFAVPSELPASTVKVDVSLPDGQVLATFQPQSRDGWKASLTRNGKGVTGVSWRAVASGIPAGNEEDFTIAAGPLPDAPTLAFLAVQTYSDGTVVRWTDPQAPGGPEPDHPAPVLRLIGSQTASATPAKSHHTSLIAGVTVAALAIAGGLLALVSRRRKRSAAS